MKLTAKILTWFFLNLAVLGVAGWFLLRSQFGLESLVSGAGSERIQSLAVAIRTELESRPPGEWAGVLERSGRAYGVKFVLAAPDGHSLAGEATAFPHAVSAKMRELAPPPPLRPPPREGPPQGPPGPPPMGPEPTSFPKALVETSGSPRFWLLVEFSLRAEGPPRPAFLVMASDSLEGGGLLLEKRPWLLFGAGAIVFSPLFWFPLVRGITGSLRQMTDAAESIAAGRFDVRVDGSRGDEIGRLARALNQMAARLDEAFSGQKRFLGDTAHELCSPLARMDVALGIVEQRAGAEHATRLADIREEISEMSALVSELLAFSKAGAKGIVASPLALAPLVATVIHREGAELVEVNVPQDFTVNANADLLKRAIGNVLRNAIRYASDAGPIRIRATREAGAVILSVTDHGPGVPPESVHRLFDPFYRPEAARTRDSGGTGLGLAIVKSCVEACGGTVAARNESPCGFTVELRLPRA